MSVLTEAEAEKRWCPFARTYVGDDGNGGVAVNRWGANYGEKQDNKCLGSHCMAWQWMSPEKTKATSLGYCGLAK